MKEHLMIILVTRVSSICLILFQTHINMNLNVTIAVNMKQVIRAPVPRSIIINLQEVIESGPYHVLIISPTPFRIAIADHCLKYCTQSLQK